MRIEINKLSFKSFQKLERYIEYKNATKHIKEKYRFNILNRDKLDYDDPARYGNDEYDLYNLEGIRRNRKRLLKEFIESLKNDNR